MLIVSAADNQDMTAIVLLSVLLVAAVLSVRHGRDSRPRYSDRQDWQTRA